MNVDGDPEMIGLESLIPLSAHTAKVVNVSSVDKMRGLVKERIRKVAEDYDGVPAEHHPLGMYAKDLEPFLQHATDRQLLDLLCNALIKSGRPMS
jgi:hypothetical protein